MIGQKGEAARRRAALFLALALVLAAVPSLRVSALELLSVGEEVPPEQVILVGAEGSADEAVFASGRRAVYTDAQGREHSVATRNGETLCAMLRRLGVEIDALELVLVDAAEETVRVYTGTEFTCYETEEAVIQPKTVVTTDYTLPKGTRTVTVEGSAGLSIMTYELTWADGQFVSRQAVAEERLIERVNERVSEGTLVSEAAPGDTIESVVTLEDGSGYLLMRSGDSLHFVGTMDVKCTAYTSGYGGAGSVTYTGTTVRVGCVAVDKSVIPLGTTMFITTNDGYLTYGMAHAEDTGVKGAKVDLYMDSYDECIAFGVRRAVAYILEWPEA